MSKRVLYAVISGDERTAQFDDIEIRELIDSRSEAFDRAALRAKASSDPYCVVKLEIVEVAVPRVEVDREVIP